MCVQNEIEYYDSFKYYMSLITKCSTKARTVESIAWLEDKIILNSVYTKVTLTNLTAYLTENRIL